MNELLGHLLHLFAVDAGKLPEDDPIAPAVVVASSASPTDMAIVVWKGKSYRVHVEAL